MTTSARNQDLIRGVINAFISTVLQFCQHDSLQYTWMRYLPQEGTHHWEPFWKRLVDGIKTRLQEERVIRTRHKRVLRRIEDMKDFTPDMLDRHGNPLLPDLDPEVYLANEYNRSDVLVLGTLGLQKLAMGRKIKTVWQDLKSENSNMRSPATEGDWHARVASMLLQPWEVVSSHNSELRKAEIRQLPIIPLEGGAWARADDGEIFYGTIGNISIPKELGLRIVSSKPAKDAKRRALFDKLGVHVAKATMVRSLIVKMYAKGDMSDVSLESSLEHLRFLYLTHESRPKAEGYLELVILDHLGQARRPREHDMYIQDDHPYGAKNLLGPRRMASFDAFFVDSRYWENPPSKPSGMSLTWVEWMYQEVGVLRNIRMVTSDDEALSEECKYIAAHQSNNFLELLRHVWPEELCNFEDDDNVLTELKEIPLLCTNGVEAPLSTCYMPLRALQTVQSRFSDADLLPFLDISSSNDTDLLTQWSFLANIVGVSCDDDFRFRTDLLTELVYTAGKPMAEADALKLFDLYRYIRAYCLGSEDPESVKARVR